MFYMLLLLLVISTANVFGNTNSAPKRFGSSNILTKRNIGIGVGGIALVGGKKVYDGPVFNEDIDLKGKTIVITGGNTGLGKDSAIALAKKGAEIIILCRNSEKAQSAVDDIKKESNNSNIDYIVVDLASLKSIDECSKKLKSQLKKIDVLQLNAGVMAIPELQYTNDGFERQFGTNHLGHFALTGKIIDLLKKSEQPRLVTVSSSAHLISTELNTQSTDELMLLDKKESYQPWKAYGNSKLANILFTREFANRYPDIISVVLHPGACRTELGRYIVDPDSIPMLVKPLLGIAISPLLYFTKSSYMGSQTQTFLSASSSLSTKLNGKFFDNSVVASTSKLADDTNLGKQLWNLSESLTKTKF